MSKIENLKKKYPELNLSIMDLFLLFDNSKTHKYLPLLCKIFGKKFSLKNRFEDSERIAEEYLRIKRVFEKKNLDVNNLSDNELFTLHFFMDQFSHNEFEIFQEFVNNCENKRLQNSDILTYNSMDELMMANSLCSLRMEEKNMECHVVKEFEDDKWIMVRPLTFSASAKYGAGTKWCTNMSDEKSYFHRYWSRGVLVYFINKNTGYKFAAFKGTTDDDDFSFWSADDKRVEFLNLDLDDYLFPIIKKIFSSNVSNKNMCSEELVSKVESECGIKIRNLFLDELTVAVQQPPTEEPQFDYTVTTTAEHHNITYTVPTERA